MATKNVKVVYTVDDSQITKAKINIQQTAAATKASEDAMMSYSKTTLSSGQQIAQTLEGQRLQLAQIKAQIDLTRQSDTERLNRLKSDYDQVKGKIDAFNKSLQDTNTAGKTANDTFNSFKTTVAAVFSAVLLRQVTSTVLEMNKLAGEVEGVDKAFRRAFPNSQVILSSLRTATHGTVTDLQLMQQTLKATNLGLPVENLGKLFEFAATRAQQTGESVDYLVNSIVSGIGRKSPLLLDNLGISAVRLKEELGGVSAKSSEVGKVADAVVKIANEELQKMGGYAETSATKVGQIEVAWQQLRIELAKKIQGAGGLSFLEEAIQGAKIIVGGSEQFKKNLADIEAAQIAANAKTKEDLDAEILRREKNIQKIKEEAKAISQKVFGTDTPDTGVLSKFTETSQQKAAKDQIASMNDLVIQRQQTVDSLKQLAQTFKGELKPAEEEQLKRIPKLKDEIEKLNEALDETNSLTDIGDINAKIAAKEAELKTLQNFKGGTVNIDEVQKDKDAEKQIIEDANIDILESDKDRYKNDEKNLEDYNKTKSKEIEDAHQQEQRAAQANADATLLIEQQAEQRKIALRRATQDFALNALDQLLTAGLIHRQDETQDIEDKYDKQVAAAGDNKAQIDAINKRRKVEEEQYRVIKAKADMDDAITKIEIDTAINVVRSILNNGGIPAGLPFGALAAAAGLIQIATVKSVSSRSLKTRAFAKGEVGIDGPGTTTSDSINAMLSRGESVINAEATGRSRNLLEAINEKKIDDRILYKIAADGGAKAPKFDSEGIIKAIESNKVDYYTQGTIIMKGERKSAEFTRKIRAKVLG